MSKPGFWLALVGGALCLAGLADAQESPELSGKLAVGTHKVKFEKGKTYAITAKGNGFQPLLRMPGSDELIYPEQQQPGTFTAYFMAPKTGEYPVNVLINSEVPIKDGSPLTYKVDVKETKDIAGYTLVVKRQWDESDPQYSNGSGYKAFPIRLKGNTTYTIELNCKDEGVDPYLFLENSDKEAIAEDDDGGGGLNSKIVYTPSKDGDFRVIATTLNNATSGSFTLKVKAGESAMMILEDALTINDLLYRNMHFCKVYTLPLKAGRMYTIDLIDKGAGIDPYVYVENSERKVLAQDDDSGGNLNSRLNFSPQEDGDYRIIATSFRPGATGGYRLTVRENAPGRR